MGTLTPEIIKRFLEYVSQFLRKPLIGVHKSSTSRIKENIPHCSELCIIRIYVMRTTLSLGNHF